MVERILVIRLSALGDIIHTLPLLDALRRAYPAARVDWLSEPLGAKLLLDDHPMIDHLWVVPRREMKENFRRAWVGPMRKLRGQLREQHYDVTIDVQGLTKSAIWGWWSGASRRIGFAGRESRELAGALNNVKVRPPEGCHHVVDRNLQLLRGLEIEPPKEIHFPVHLPAGAIRRADKILGGDGAPLAVINPGAGWATKRWGAERFAALARRLVELHHMRVGIAWGPGEEALAEEVLAHAGEPEPDYSRRDIPDEPGIYLLPATTMLELGAVIASAAIFIGGDTGPTHLAAALGVPTVSMMGPLDARRNGPYGDKAITIQHAIPRRAPWWANHRRWCDPSTRLDAISVDEVYDAVQTALGRWPGQDDQ